MAMKDGVVLFLVKRVVIGREYNIDYLGIGDVLFFVLESDYINMFEKIY